METRKTSIRRRLMLIGASAALALAAWGFSSSYAWYAHSDTSNDIGYLGKVIVGIGNDSKVDKHGIATFEISNGSTIDIYLRLGWTPIYKSEGKELTKNTENIMITDVQLTGEAASDNALEGTKLMPGNITLPNGYIKRMINTEDGDGKYFAVPAGTNVTGWAKVNAESSLSEEREDLTDGADSVLEEELYIIFVPEALQATKAAVAEAASYGWDIDKVGAQADTLAVTDLEGGDYNEAD